MTIETTLPEAPVLPDAGAGEQQTAALADDNTEQREGEQTESKEEKPERHPLEKELAKERRRISRLVEQREMSRAEAAQLRQEVERIRGGLQTQHGSGDNEDADILKIPRSELPRVLERLQGEAASERENRQAVQRMAKALGDDFKSVTNELAEIIPSADLQFAVADSESPAELARYLIDPDNADEAERIARMQPLQAGRALAKIEAKLSASKDKPQPSKAPRPVEPVRGAGSASAAAPADMESYMAWANKQYSRK